MKKMKLWIMAAILFSGVACMTSCNGQAKVEKEAEAAEVALNGLGGNLEALISKYLVDSIGSQYAPGEICIPVVVYQTDEIKEDSLFVWGDYWVFNYNVVGDTLKCVSGGSHPGKLLVRKNEQGEDQVVSFEQVEAGHGNVESAKRIFGKNYDAFHSANSDEVYREEVRASGIADYVKAHKLPVKYYQDYGWPAKEIPTQDAPAQ